MQVVAVAAIVVVVVVVVVVAAAVVSVAVGGGVVVAVSRGAVESRGVVAVVRSDAVVVTDSVANEHDRNLCRQFNFDLVTTT